MMENTIDPEIAKYPGLERYFKKLTKIRKVQRCRLCGQRIQPGESVLSWSTVERGYGWQTSYAHPECYHETIVEKWDDHDWECMGPGDMKRPKGEEAE